MSWILKLKTKSKLTARNTKDDAKIECEIESNATFFVYKLVS